MADPKPTLIDLGDTDLRLENPLEDIRHRTVHDRVGEKIGEVEGLIIDEGERKVRFIRIGSGGFLGLGRTERLVPVDAITRIGATDVHIDRTREHVAGSSPYDPAIVDRVEFYRDLYNHYGIQPFWTPGYVYPPIW